MRLEGPARTPKSGWLAHRRLASNADETLSKVVFEPDCTQRSPGSRDDVLALPSHPRGSG